MQKIESEDGRLVKSYQETRSLIDNFFLSVQQMVSDRERALLNEVETKQSELVSKLDSSYSELDAAEKDCQLWLQRAEKLIGGLKEREISATGEYEVCLSGLRSAQEKIATLNSQLVRMLQLPPIINFTANSEELEVEIQSLGEFDFYTTTAMQKPDMVAYYQVREETSRANKDVYSEPRNSTWAFGNQQKQPATMNLPKCANPSLPRSPRYLDSQIQTRYLSTNQTWSSHRRCWSPRRMPPFNQYEPASLPTRSLSLTVREVP